MFPCRAVYECVWMCFFSSKCGWGLLRPKYPPKIQNPKYLTGTQKPLKARQGHTKHVRNLSESNSQKRRGHWHLKEFRVLRFNQPFVVLAFARVVRLVTSSTKCYIHLPTWDQICGKRDLLLLAFPRGVRFAASSMLEKWKIVSLTHLVSYSRAVGRLRDEVQPSLTRELMPMHFNVKLRSTCCFDNQATPSFELFVSVHYLSLSNAYVLTQSICSSTTLGVDYKFTVTASKGFSGGPLWSEVRSDNVSCVVSTSAQDIPLVSVAPKANT